MLCDKEFVTAEKKSAWEENRKLLRTNVTSLAAFGFGDAHEKLKIKRMFSFFFLSTIISFWLRKMQKSNYSVTLITLLIITITLSHYHNSPNRKGKLQITPIFGNFTLFNSSLSVQKIRHVFSPFSFLLHSVLHISLPQKLISHSVQHACAPPGHDLNATF